MQNQRAIQQLGYTAKEAKVYLAALRLGESTIADIATHLKMPRSTAQITIDKLHGDGLMAFYEMHGHKYWVAENPENLLVRIRKREKTLEGILPELVEMKRAGRRNKIKNGIKSDDFFKIFADDATYPVLVTNERGEIEYVNAMWKSLFGFSQKEVRGETQLIFRKNESEIKVYEYMLQRLASGKPFQSTNVQCRKKDGSTLNLATTVFPFKHNGKMFYVQILDEASKD